MFGLGRAYNSLAVGTIIGFTTGTQAPGLGGLTGALYRMLSFFVLHMKIVSQLAAAAGVILLLLWYRHRVTDAMTGLVLGAAVGLGYAFTESVGFIQLADLLGGSPA